MPEPLADGRAGEDGASVVGEPRGAGVAVRGEALEHEGEVRVGGRERARDEGGAGRDRALRDPDVIAKLTQQGAIVAGGTPEEFAAFMQGEFERWGDVIKKAGIKVE